MTGYGYEPYDTPIIQPTDLFLTRAGDQIVKRLFTFERDGQSIALRPEFTAPAAYAYAQQHPRGDSVVRWQFSGFVFVDYATGAQQRMSVGAELFGAAGADADAEIITMATHGLDAVGVRDWSIDIGHVGLLRAVLGRFQLDMRTERFILHHLAALSNPAQGKSYVLEQLDRLLQAPPEVDFSIPTVSDVEHTLGVVLESGHYGVTMGGRDRADIARRLIQKRQRFTERHDVSLALDVLEHVGSAWTNAERAFIDLGGVMETDAERALLTEWRDTVRAVIAAGVDANRITIRPTLARDWEYYTGVVFELRSSYNAHIGGGGRYDELVKLLGGEGETPAVGFVYHIDPLITGMEADA
jgi:histidyl-tRNA synthetase